LGERILPQGIAERKKTSFLKFTGQQEELLINSIINDRAFKDSYILRQIFNNSLFKNIQDLPLSLRWKVANLYRFEKIFF
jgi:hypothetical protein